MHSDEGSITDDNPALDRRQPLANRRQGIGGIVRMMGIHDRAVSSNRDIVANRDLALTHDVDTLLNHYAVTDP